MTITNTHAQPSFPANGPFRSAAGVTYTRERAALWEPEVRQFEARDAVAPPAAGGILFAGSSSIRLWDTDRWFPGVGIINRGFGGTHIDDSTHFADRIILPYQPRMIVFYAGDNDIGAGHTPYRVVQSFRTFVELIHRHLPTTNIVFISIKPTIARWRLVDHVRMSNKLIQQDIDRNPLLAYADVFTPSLDQRGRPRRELLVEDGQHLTEQGYELWTQVVDPFVRNR